MLRLLYFSILFAAVLRAQEGTILLEGTFLLQAQTDEKKCFFSIEENLATPRIIPVSCRPDLVAQYKYELEFGFNGCQLSPQKIIRIIPPEEPLRVYKKLDKLFIRSGISKDCF